MNDFMDCNFLEAMLPIVNITFLKISGMAEFPRRLRGRLDLGRVSAMSPIATKAWRTGEVEPALEPGAGSAMAAARAARGDEQVSGLGGGADRLRRDWRRFDRGSSARAIFAALRGSRAAGAKAAGRRPSPR
jgi:hypothetical protein